MKKRIWAPLAGVVIIGSLGLMGESPTVADDGAEYTVTFSGMWTPASHPFEYPKGSIITGAHFGPVLVVSHNDRFSSFEEGSMPSPGLERQSETGKPDVLKEEVDAAIKAGSAGSVTILDPLRDLSETTSGMIKVDSMHPWVSATTMIAPSPDWFAGVSVNLWEGGKWVPAKSIELFAWDSGGDDGNTYKASDKDTDPKKPTMMAKTKHFLKDGKPNPVAKIVFTKK